MAKWIDLIGTSLNSIKLGLTGVLLKNSSGNLTIRNNADSEDASVTASTINVSGDSLVINSDATNSGVDRSITLSRPTSGMSASYTLTLPVDDGTPSQVLQTDGSGVLSWVTSAGGSNTDKLSFVQTALAFGSTSPVTMFTLPANALVKEIEVIVDTPFDGTPSLSIGVSGTVSKYFPATQIDLTASSKVSFVNSANEIPSVSSENLIATYSAGSATVGAARIITSYVIPA
jgi:hypothetical protein